MMKCISWLLGLFVILGIVSSCTTYNYTYTLQPISKTYEVNGAESMFAISKDEMEVQTSYHGMYDHYAIFNLLYFNHSAKPIVIDPMTISMACSDTVKNKILEYRPYDVGKKVDELSKEIEKWEGAIGAEQHVYYLKKEMERWSQGTLLKDTVAANKETRGDVIVSFTIRPKNINKCLLLVPSSSDTIAFPYRIVAQ